MEEVAAGRGFPVEHLAAAIHAGEFAQHQRVVEFAPADAACAADRFGDGARLGERDAAFFHRAGERFGVGKGAVKLRENCAGGFGKFPAEAGFGEEVAARRLHFRYEFFDGECGFEIHGERGRGHGPEGSPELIDARSFDAIAREHQLAVRRRITGADMEIVQGLTLHGSASFVGPCDFPAAVCRPQRLHPDSVFF